MYKVLAPRGNIRPPLSITKDSQEVYEIGKIINYLSKSLMALRYTRGGGDTGVVGLSTSSGATLCQV